MFRELQQIKFEGNKNLGGWQNLKIRDGKKHFRGGSYKYILAMEGGRRWQNNHIQAWLTFLHFLMSYVSYFDAILW